MNNNKKKPALLLLALLLPGIPAFALEGMDDAALSLVEAQAGLDINITSPTTGIPVDRLNYCMDTGVSYCSATPTGSDAGRIQLSGINMGKIGLNGATATGSFTASVNVDAGSTAVSGGNTGLSVVADWSQSRFKFDNLYLGYGASPVSLGNMALDATGHFELRGDSGFLSTGATSTKLYLSLLNGSLFFRHSTAASSPELEWGNLSFIWDMPAALVGVDSTGIRIEGDANFRLLFDWYYDPTGATPLAIGTNDAQDMPLFRFGWDGGLKSTALRISSGGAWLASSTYGTGTNVKYNRPQDPLNPGTPVVSQGINLGISFNYVDSTGTNPFKLTLGEIADASGNVVTLEFTNWQTLPGSTQTAEQPVPTTKSFYFPLIVLDILRAGRGPGGLCWGANWEGPSSSCQDASHGGQYLEIAPEDNAMAVLVRDGFLRAYSSGVTIKDPTSTVLAYRNRTLGWALVATLGNIDGNLYIMPDARAGSSGLKLDALLMSQTFDVGDKKGVDGKSNTNQFEQGPNWSYGSHFMIADTGPGNCSTSNNCLGIGFKNGSYLVAADNLYFNFLKSGVRTGGAGASDVRPAGISIGDSELLSTTAASTTSFVRLAVNTSFGGGDVPNMTREVKGADMYFNFEFDRLHVMLTPPPSGSRFLGLDATMRFADLDIANFSQSSDATNDPGSNFVLAEPGRLAASVRFSNITGWMALRDGRIDLKHDVETASDISEQLSIGGNLLIGRSVTNVAGAELVIGKVETSTLGTGGLVNYNNLGSIVIPGGQWYSRIALQPK